MQYLLSAITAILPCLMLFVSFNSEGILKKNAKKVTKKIKAEQESMDKKISQLFMKCAIILGIMTIGGNALLYSLGHEDYTLFILVVVEILVMIFFGMKILRIVDANKL